MTWLVEQGIGEERALQYRNGRAVSARLRWPGGLEAGLVADAVLVERAKGAFRGRARFSGGEDALVDRLPPDASEGAPLGLEVTRAAVTERKRGKLAQARPTDADPRPAPTLAETLPDFSVVRRFPDGAWDELWSEAWEGDVTFPGGALQFAPTAAMTLIDVDGPLAARALALAAVPALAASLTRFDLGGSIGVDFPTLAAREDRKAVDALLGQALSGWAHERTAMNGFGFVQLVARQTGPSLLHRLAFDRAGAAARKLLRDAEGLAGAGAVLLAAHPAVVAALLPEWLTELAQRTGREVRVQPAADVALGPGHAQMVPR
ncbi:ribonuclease [Altererythrobacter sp. TH136]|uniref:ribonuclease n=1 Tax=Altererythrobacter sp. TH136 TaxID=2067415 RepID=UPI0011648E90|nr:ribonuclease [Altererythrobacter sp. TH136]QDM40582.1 ribonuclease [Altererythrobacter sp. TH136]